MTILNPLVSHPTNSKPRNNFYELLYVGYIRFTNTPVLQACSSSLKVAWGPNGTSHCLRHSGSQFGVWGLAGSTAEAVERGVAPRCCASPVRIVVVRSDSGALRSTLNRSCSSVGTSCFRFRVVVSCFVSFPPCSKRAAWQHYFA